MFYNSGDDVPELVGPLGPSSGSDKEAPSSDIETVHRPLEVEGVLLFVWCIFICCVVFFGSYCVV